MIQPKSVIEQLMFATVRIEASLANGETSVGTAFFFNFKVDDQSYMPAIVTNKHVVSGAVTGRLKVHLADKNAPDLPPTDQSEYLALDRFEQRFFLHPAPTLTYAPCRSGRCAMRRSGKGRSSITRRLATH